MSPLGRLTSSSHIVAVGDLGREAKHLGDALAGEVRVLPHDVLVSANFEHRSGTPYARTVSFTGGTQIPSLVARVEPIGARRLPNINLLHMRFEKSLRLTQGQKVALRVNVYNVTNINSEQSITQLSGVNFGRPAGVVPPRILELGVNYTF